MSESERLCARPEGCLFRDGLVKGKYSLCKLKDTWVNCMEMGCLLRGDGKWRMGNERIG